MLFMSLFTSANNWYACFALSAMVRISKVKTWLYGLLSILLLFTAAIVLNIESVQQTLNITLERAYIYVFVPDEV